MDIPQVLAVLRPGEDWGPCAQTESTYADLARTWRSDSVCPTEGEMLACWVALESGRAAALDRQRRADAGALLMGTRPPDVETLAWLVRYLVSDLYTAINVVRVHVGLEKELEPEIVARLVAGIAPVP